MTKKITIDKLNVEHEKELVPSYLIDDVDVYKANVYKNSNLPTPNISNIALTNASNINSDYNHEMKSLKRNTTRETLLKLSKRVVSLKDSNISKDKARRAEKGRKQSKPHHVSTENAHEEVTHIDQDSSLEEQLDRTRSGSPKRENGNDLNLSKSASPVINDKVKALLDNMFGDDESTSKNDELLDQISDTISDDGGRLFDDSDDESIVKKPTSSNGLFTAESIVPNDENPSNDYDECNYDSDGNLVSKTTIPKENITSVTVEATNNENEGTDEELRMKKKVVSYDTAFEILIIMTLFIGSY